ncbi:ribosomal protein S16 [Aulographum hederae CBS 113979]|uniref:Ribosomal protein S16 n=1 Tax=Aulographum hederae CBS 113979 TaxID=1176131 RepID=A0A6G1H6M0_9PEZI|nr:ribosomal protein S16 [Aulographum hederae CBS 113979]
MVVRIRLARFGRKHAPFYNIVVAQARSARNSRPMEVLGTFNPLPQERVDGEGKPYKDVKLDSSRAKYWLGVGAQPSDPVWRLFSMVGIIEPKYSLDEARKNAIKADAALRDSELSSQEPTPSQS